MSSSNSNDDLSRPPSSVDQCDGDAGSGTAAANHITAANRRAGSASPTASRADHLDDIDRAADAKTDGKLSVLKCSRFVLMAGH